MLRLGRWRAAIAPLLAMQRCVRLSAVRSAPQRFLATTRSSPPRVRSAAPAKPARDLAPPAAAAPPAAPASAAPISSESNARISTGGIPTDDEGRLLQPFPPSALPPAEAQGEPARQPRKMVHPSAAEINAQQTKDEGLVRAVQNLDLMTFGLNAEGRDLSASGSAWGSAAGAVVSKPSYRGRVIRTTNTFVSAPPGKLTAAQAVAMFSLHAKQPAHWTAQALAERFALDVATVEVALSTTAAPYVSFDKGVDAYVGTPTPVSSSVGAVPGSASTANASANTALASGEAIIYADFLPFQEPRKLG